MAKDLAKNTAFLLGEKVAFVPGLPKLVQCLSLHHHLLQRYSLSLSMTITSTMTMSLVDEKNLIFAAIDLQRSVYKARWLKQQPLLLLLLNIPGPGLGWMCANGH